MAVNPTNFFGGGAGPGALPAPPPTAAIPQQILVFQYDDLGSLPPVESVPDGTIALTRDDMKVYQTAGGAWVFRGHVAVDGDLYLLLAGGTMTGPIVMDANAVTGLPAPVGADDATRKVYVDDQDAATLAAVPATPMTLTNKVIESFTNDVDADDVHFEVRNATGATIPAGTPVHVTGYNPGNERVTVGPAASGAEATMPAVGITKHDLPNNTNGAAISIGRVIGVNTSAFTVGDILYVASGGGLTDVIPTGADVVQPIAVVLRSHASLGVLEVQAQVPVLRATETEPGVARLATMAAALAGVETDTAVTPQGAALRVLKAGDTMTGDLLVDTTGRIRIPAGTTAQRPGAPAAGDIRFNADLNEYEGYDGTAWAPMGGGATGSPGNPVFFENDQEVTGDYTITAGKNAMSAGPITVDAGVTVTVPAGSTWTVV